VSSTLADVSGDGAEVRQRFMGALGEASLKGWRERLARPVARAVSSRTNLTEQQIRAFIGLAFLALSVYGLVSTVRRALESRYV
jgi:hypothetical protein